MLREMLGLTAKLENRAAAGRALAARLLDRRDAGAVVLALPRGGVPVAAEIASALGAPLDLVFVRKIGAPGEPELAIGAVVDGGHPETVVNEDVLAGVGAPPGYFESERDRQLAEIGRRRAAYLRGRAPVPLAGRTAIVVDDGIATGATVAAALRSVRAAKPARVILAVPVAAPDALDRLRAEADEIVCLSAPALFGGVGSHYRDFAQVSDDEVIALLDRAPQPTAR